jgi:thiol:disulfide interchange protein DsbC
MKLIIKTVVLFGLSFSIFATEANEKIIRQVLGKSMPALKIDSIQPIQIQGLYEVIAGPNLFYVSPDGKYLLQGKLIDVEARRDLTEEKLAGIRVKAVKQVGTDQMIIYKPEKSKYTVSVFTDIDCGYCRKLHSEMDQYLAEGITIQYLFFPRAGKGSESYNKAVSVWCAEDRNTALTDAKNGKDPEEKTCTNPVDAHMVLGEELGARGTPMLVTEKGTVYPGYMPAKTLVEALQSEVN